MAKLSGDILLSIGLMTFTNWPDSLLCWLYCTLKVNRSLGWSLGWGAAHNKPARYANSGNNWRDSNGSWLFGRRPILRIYGTVRYSCTGSPPLLLRLSPPITGARRRPSLAWPGPAVRSLAGFYDCCLRPNNCVLLTFYWRFCILREY